MVLLNLSLSFYILGLFGVECLGFLGRFLIIRLLNWLNIIRKLVYSALRLVASNRRLTVAASLSISLAGMRHATVLRTADVTCFLGWLILSIVVKARWHV